MDWGFGWWWMGLVMVGLLALAIALGVLAAYALLDATRSGIRPRRTVFHPGEQSPDSDSRRGEAGPGL